MARYVFFQGIAADFVPHSLKVYALSHIDYLLRNDSQNNPRIISVKVFSTNRHMLFKVPMSYFQNVWKNILNNESIFKTLHT